MAESKVDPRDISAIGISYQMHGLVCIDSACNVIRPAIIWCDSRGVPYGEKAFGELGSDLCLGHLLNSPGNFTATKLAWVKENEAEVFDRIWKIILPVTTSPCVSQAVCPPTVAASRDDALGLQEGAPAAFLMDYLDFPLTYYPKSCLHSPSRALSPPR